MTPRSDETSSARLQRLLSLIACPQCSAGGLEKNRDLLSCAHCGRQYLLREGVPDFTAGRPDPCTGFEYQWKAWKQGTFESDTLYGKSAEYELDQFFKCLGVERNDTRRLLVLDAGCGGGRLVMLLSRANFEIVGLDFTSSVLAIDREARSRGLDHVHLIQGDLLQIPIKSGLFDCIWSGGVIHHTGNTRLAFQNLVKVLKPGGRIFVWVYSADQGVFGRVRQVLPFAHRLPHGVLLLLCRVLAVPIWLLGRLAGEPHPMREVVFKLFDHLSPRFRTVHRESELMDWYRAEGLEDIRIEIREHTGGIGIRGTKSVSRREGVSPDRTVGPLPATVGA